MSVLGPLVEDAQLPLHEGQEFHGKKGRRGGEPDEGSEEEEGEDVFQFLNLQAGEGHRLLPMGGPDVGEEVPAPAEQGSFHGRFDGWLPPFTFVENPATVRMKSPLTTLQKVTGVP